MQRRDHTNTWAEKDNERLGNRQRQRNRETEKEETETEKQRNRETEKEETETEKQRHRLNVSDFLKHAKKKRFEFERDRQTDRKYYLPKHTQNQSF